MPHVNRFGNRYSKQRNHVHHTKFEMIQAWPYTKDMEGVKSFLQALQFCQVIIRPDLIFGWQTYSHITLHSQEHQI